MAVGNRKRVDSRENDSQGFWPGVCGGDASCREAVREVRTLGEGADEPC